MSTLNVDKVDPSTGTALEIGSSGDTITIPSGATIVNSGTATGFGAALTGSTNNTVTTVTAANAISGEAKLLFDPAKLTIGNASEEDTSIVFDGHAQDYYIGLDDTDDDLKIGLGSAVGTTSYMVFDETGAVTKPLQPAFYATLAANVDPGTSSDYNPIFNTEIFDNNADYNTTNYTFTAPVTGRYLLVSTVRGYGVTTSFSITHNIVTSNRTYSNNVGRFYSDQWGVTIVALADMDASDTAIILVNADESSYYISSGTYSYFHGHLVC
jgi:hypothetical protein